MTATRWLALLSLGSLASGCARRDVHVRYGAVHRHLGELRRTGTARVETIESPAGAPAPLVGVSSAAVLAFDRTVSLGGKLTTLRRLSDGCRDVPPFRGAEPPNPCGLIVHRDDHFVIRTRRIPPSAHAITTGVITTLGFGTLGGAIYCGFRCDSYNEAKAIGIAVGGLILLTAAAIRSGARD